MKYRTITPASEKPDDLRKALLALGVPGDEFHIPDFGETLQIRDEDLSALDA